MPYYGHDGREYEDLEGDNMRAELREANQETDEESTAPMVPPRRYKRQVRITEQNDVMVSMDTSKVYPSDDLPDWFKPLCAIIEDADVEEVIINLHDVHYLITPEEGSQGQAMKMRDILREQIIALRTYIEDLNSTGTSEVEARACELLQEALQNTESAYDTLEQARNQGRPPICATCQCALTPATTIQYNGKLYCPDCVPDYDKHEQW